MVKSHGGESNDLLLVGILPKVKAVKREKLLQLHMAKPRSHSKGFKNAPRAKIIRYNRG